MRILHLVEPFSSGIITFIIYLTKELPQHEHIVIHGTRVTQDRVSAVRKRFPSYVKFEVWPDAVREIAPLKDFLALIQLLRFYKRLKPDVIHLHSSKAGFLGRVAGFFFNYKIIYTPNGAPFLRTDISRFKRRMYIFLERFANLLAGKVICCSLSESEAYHKIGLTTDYINNGVSVHQTEKISTRKFTIGNFALITEQKNPVLFNEIAYHFINNDRVRFLWVGDGDRSLLNSPNIEITGWLDEKQVEKKYAEVDVYLSTSIWEGLPFSVLEAMNAQTCLLLSNCVGNIDLVKENGYNGYIYNGTQDAIKKIIEIKENKEKIKRMGQNSKKYLIENFNAATNMKQYEEFYKQQ